MKSTSRWFDWFSAILLVAAFGTVAIRLRVTNWTANLEVIEVLGLIACVLGLLLGASKFSSLACQLFAVNFTLFFIPWQLGLLVGKDIDWDQRLLSLFGRLSYSINQVATNHPIQDALLFLTTMSLFFWLLALIAGYQLARNGRPWVSLFLLGLALAIIDFYTPFQGNRDRYSGIFVFLVLLMVARIYFLRSRKEWVAKGMAIDPEIGYDLGRTVAFCGLALVLLAWNVPTVIDALTPGTTIQKDLAKQWESVRNRFQNAVAGLQNPVSITSDYYGSELALGTGGAQGDDLVFTVQVPGGRPTGVRFYWKARSFDTYDGTQWVTTESQTRSVLANGWSFLYPQTEARKEVTFNITTNLASMRNIYTAGIPLQVTRPSDVLTDTYPNGSVDVIAVVANPPIRGGEVYTERSSVSAPTVYQLSNSSVNYPTDIKNLYLQLPSTFSPRVVELAKQITAGLTNPYDKAMAITDWLRKNIQYTLTVPAAPADRDIMEWFLFDLKKGYCNYYATAEVVMLRSIGIPARLAVGYAEGESQQNGDSYLVRRRDSHAWPEVYFSAFGWIEFEPTAAQPQTSLPVGSAATDQAIPGRAPNPLFPNEEPTEDPSRLNPIPTPTPPVNPLELAASIGIPLVLVVGVIFFFWLRRTGRLPVLVVPLPILVTKNLEKRGLVPPGWLKSWANHIELSPMERLFARFSWMLFLLGRKPVQSHTPAERVADLISAAPNTKESAEIFLIEYQHEEYSLKHGNLGIAQQAYRRLWREVTVGALRRLFSA
jgi:transglutaminase-like putative cysteine protease